MICKNCGTEIQEGEKFCAVCGAPVEETPVYSNNSATYTAAGNDAPLGLSIAALILALNIPIVGFILACIARKKIKNYKRDGGLIAGKAKAANILANIALPVSIVMMVIIAIYVIVIVGAMVATFSSSIVYDI